MTHGTVAMVTEAGAAAAGGVASRCKRLRRADGSGVFRCYTSPEEQPGERVQSWRLRYQLCNEQNAVATTHTSGIAGCTRTIVSVDFHESFC